MHRSSFLAFALLASCGSSGAATDTAVDASSGVSQDGASADGGGLGDDSSSSGEAMVSGEPPFLYVGWDAAPPCDATSCSTAPTCDAGSCATLGMFCQTPASGFNGSSLTAYSECTDSGWVGPDWCEYDPMSPQGLPCGYPPATAWQSTCEHVVQNGVEIYTCTDAGWQP
jgi:hypothetical protein